MSTLREVTGVYSAPHQHWVGDGFPVRSLFSYTGLGQHLSPFLLLDYAGPAHFEPAERPRGVGQHPHRGFETVTIVYEGEVSHRDSSGGGGTIGPGDVQWMTAASGIIHEEFHSQAYTRRGGPFEMVQLWVNLPARDKLGPPRYQSILATDIPTVALPEDAGRVRVIAGTYGDAAGPARTFTPMDVLDVRLRQGRSTTLTFGEGRTVALVVLRGAVRVNGGDVAHDAQLVVFERDGGDVHVEATRDAVLMLLSGEPIEEPIVGYGPFVMNTQAEIREAVADYNAGRFGGIR